MKAVISFLAFVVSVLAQSREFEEFLHTHNKVYKDDIELQARQKIFEDNKKIIDKHNQRYAQGLETFEMGVNQFTDLTTSEFQNLILGTYNQSETNGYANINIYNSPVNFDIPDEINWVEEGAVTPVKDQGSCGACWAFAAVAALEGQYFRKTGKLVELSAQNLLDCSSTSHYRNNGCIGGTPYGALRYVLDNNGIQTEKTYSYVARQGYCVYNKQFRAVAIDGIEALIFKDERLLAAAVAEKGPIAVGIDSQHFQHYHRGVLRKQCYNNEYHALTIVGYGHDSDGGDYWLLKNSWGSSWGENGYVRMARNEGYMCFSGDPVLFPIVRQS